MSEPGDWHEAALGEVADVSWGNTSLTKAAYVGTGYLAFSASGPDGFLDHYEHETDGIVLSAIGARCGRCFWARDRWSAIKNTITITGPKAGKSDLGFLFHYLNRDGIWPSNGGAQPFIGLGNARSLRIPVPPLGEQRRIASILSTVDEAIVAAQTVIDQLQVVKKAMMMELFSRGLPGRHTHFKQTEIGTVPEDWEVVRIADVADVDYGISAAVSKNTNPSIGWPIITGANLTLGGGLDLSEVVYHPPPKSPQHLLRPGDLLLNWRSGSAAHVGKTAFFDRPENHTYASFVLRIRSRGRLVPRFGHALLNFMREQEYFSRDLSQQVNFKMNAAVFRDVLIRLPGVAEQRAIADACTTVDGSIASNRETMTQRARLKSALMSVLLTGEVRVKPEEEAA